MKKTVVALLLVLVLALCACSNGGNEPKESSSQSETKATPNFDVPAGGYDGSAVKISFYVSMSQDKVDLTKKYVEEFNRLYPNITVEISAIGSYDDVRDQINTELTVGSEPNIAYCYPDHVAMYRKAKAAVSLDNLINSTITVNHADGTTEILGLTAEQKADFIEGYYNEGAQFGDGLMYTMPFSKSTEVLYYNKTFFDANGLTPPKTWDEMEALCAKIKEIDPSKNSFPLGYDSEANWFITMCEQYGSPYTSAEGEHYLFNNQTNRDFVKRFSTWYDKGYVTVQTIIGGYTSSLFKNTDPEKDHSYMSIGSSAGANHQRPDKEDGKYPFEVGIATIPQIDPSNPKVISQGPSVCIFKKSNPQEVIASWLLVKYLTTSVEFQAEFADISGYVPVLKSVQTFPAYAELLASADGYDNVTYLSAKVCMEQANAYYTSPAFVGSSTARSQVGNLLAKCLHFDTSASDIDKKIQDAFQEAIDECEYHG